MNDLILRIILCVLAGLPLLRASDDLVVRDGGKIIVHSQVLLKSGDFKAENGAIVAIDLGGKITASGSIVYGGALQVDAAGGGALDEGKAYQLFSGAGYPASFSSVSLPALNAPLYWSTQALRQSGSISIFKVVPPAPSFSAPGGGGTAPNIGGISTFSIDDPNAVWNFGDGTTATGGTVTHTYSIPGVYIVTVTVLDPNGNPQSQTFTVTVNATPFRITSARIKFSPSQDTLKLRGIANLTSLKNQPIVATLGGLSRTFMLNERGLGVSGKDVFHVRARRQSTSANQETTLTLSLKGDLQDGLKAGSTLDTNGFPEQIPVVIQLGDSYLGTTLSMKFKSTPNGALGQKQR